MGPNIDSYMGCCSEDPEIGPPILGDTLAPKTLAPRVEILPSHVVYLYLEASSSSEQAPTKKP